MKKRKEVKPKVLIVRVEMSEADYARARQFYTHEEMKKMIAGDGLAWLLNVVGRHVQACLEAWTAL